jgi:hypothetical protein
MIRCVSRHLLTASAGFRRSGGGACVRLHGWGVGRTMRRKLLATGVLVLTLWRPIEFILDWIGTIDTARAMLAPDHWAYRVVFWSHLGTLMTGLGLLSSVAVTYFVWWEPRTQRTAPSTEVSPDVQVFWHSPSGTAAKETADQIEALFRNKARNVESARTELAIHAGGVWVHGADPNGRAEAIELLKTAGIEAKIDNRESGGPLQIIAATPDVEPARVEKLEWRNGNPSDSRAEYRAWLHVVFLVRSKQKVRASAHIELEHNGTRDRRRGRIASDAGYHAHEIYPLPTGEQLSVPCVMRLEADTRLWVDNGPRRRGVLGAVLPKPVLAGWYLTDDPFLSDLHRDPLHPGDYRVRVVLCVDGEDKSTEWRDFVVE